MTAVLVTSEARERQRNVKEYEEYEWRQCVNEEQNVADVSNRRTTLKVKLECCSKVYWRRAAFGDGLTADAPAVYHEEFKLRGFVCI